MSCLTFCSSNEIKDDLKVLTTQIGLNETNGPYYTIKNADIISDKFQKIKFIIKNAYDNEVKFTKIYKVSDFDLKYEYTELEIKSHPTKYPYMCFNINGETIYEQLHHIIVDVEVKIYSKYKIKDINKILKIYEVRCYDK